MPCRRCVSPPPVRHHLTERCVSLSRQGPSEAEKKLEELTRRLEEELEGGEDEGEYFGQSTRGVGPTGAGRERRGRDSVWAIYS